MAKMTSKKKITRNDHYRLNARRFNDMKIGIDLVADQFQPVFGPHPEITSPSSINMRTNNFTSPNFASSYHKGHILNAQQSHGADFAHFTMQEMNDRLNDGSKTMLLMMRSIYGQSVNYLSRTGNARWLQYHLYDGIKLINQSLQQMNQAVDLKEDIENIATSACEYDSIATLLSEIFEHIGPYGSLEIVKSNDSPRILKREYIQGSNWKASYYRIPQDIDNSNADDLVHSLYQLEDPYIFISDYEFSDLESIKNIIDHFVLMGLESVVLIAEDISPDGVAYIYQHNKTHKDITIVPVNCPGNNILDRADNLKLISLLTDAKSFYSVSPVPLNEINVYDLGQARRVWVGKSKFGIIGGRSDPKKLRAYIDNLKNNYQRSADPITRSRILDQLGSLINGQAILTIDGETHYDQAQRMEAAKRTSSTIRNALMLGSVSGGGSSLLDCRSILYKKMTENFDIDKRAAYRILIRALEEPCRTLINNSGEDPDRLIPKIRKAGKGYCFDIKHKKIVNARDAGILDSTLVLTEAVRTAIHFAVVALTADTSVTKRPPISQKFDTLR